MLRAHKSLYARFHVSLPKSFRFVLTWLSYFNALNSRKGTKIAIIAARVEVIVFFPAKNEEGTIENSIATVKQSYYKPYVILS
jgi:hypothetical protein